MNTHTVFIVLELVCFLCATAGVPSGIAIGWPGMAFWAVERLIGG